MPSEEPIVAVGLLTRSDIAQLGNSFNRLWPVEEMPCFGALLTAIDEADREYWRKRDRAEKTTATDLQKVQVIRVR